MGGNQRGCREHCTVLIKGCNGERMHMLVGIGAAFRATIRNCASEFEMKFAILDTGGLKSGSNVDF